MRDHPSLYEINSLAFISRLSAKYNQPLTLATIPDGEWTALSQLGFDLIWMMGVWQRSPESRRLVLANSGLRKEFDRLLPGWTSADVCGSPYAIYSYTVEPDLGTDDDLLALKEKLNRLGMGLVLDFVPNHLALDHPWTLANPEWFVQGDESEVEKHPEWYFPSQGRYLAHGRDPYFAAWNDTVQVNFFREDLRTALIGELGRVSRLCDGVRCDMAMLALNGVFEWVWGGVLNSVTAPDTEFWDLAIPEIRSRYPDFMLIAEVYWGLENRLQQMGFNFTYDKPLYDHLKWDVASEIMHHIRTEGKQQDREAHFIENHDEPRAIPGLGRERSMAAAVVMSTIPGLHIYQDGQLEGRSIRIPVQLGREPFEFADPEVSLFYRRLLKLCNTEVLHDGQWEPVETLKGWEGSQSYLDILAWKWRLDREQVIVAINYSSSRAQAWLKVGPPSPGATRVVFQDVLTGTTYVRDPAELGSKGLYVDLGPFRAHLMYTTSY